MSKQIITSLLDVDYYKFTMGNVAYSQFPDMNVRYKFKLRNKDGVDWTYEEKAEILDQLKNWSNLSFKSDEILFLRSQKIFSDAYLEFLKGYTPDMKHLSKFSLCDFGPLQIEVAGPWCQTIFWEIAVLAIVNEVYFKRYADSNGMPREGYEESLSKLRENIEIANDAGFTWIDYGSRRRFSRPWQDKAVGLAVEHAHTFAGTSNVYLAKKHGISPKGTMAHEYLQIGQAIAHPLDAQKVMLQRWCDQYRGKLGIALTDIVGTEAFLKDFDCYFAKLYDGVRHDSGDPYWWADKMISHYEKLGVDPVTKAFVFSDGLDFPKSANLHKHYEERVITGFGIGTKFTNDIYGLDPLQIVMKIVEVNGRPVAKISDSPGKGMCEDENYIKYLRNIHK